MTALTQESLSLEEVVVSDLLLRRGSVKDLEVSSGEVVLTDVISVKTLLIMRGSWQTTLPLIYISKINQTYLKHPTFLTRWEGDS